MPTADSINTTALGYTLESLRHRILAAEADINALIAVRTDADAIQRTEGNYRGLVVKQDRAQSTNRGDSRMQRAQPDDKPRHAGLRPDPLTRKPRR